MGMNLADDPLDFYLSSMMKKRNQELKMSENMDKLRLMNVHNDAFMKMLI